jgi:hypothetical protein
LPLLPPINLAPYDIVDTIMNTARVRMNDAIASLGGDILTNEQPFTQQMVNSAWRRLQQYLSNLGYTRLINETIITALPICGSSDPAVQCWLDWTGFYDGTQIFTGYTLPQKCAFILKLWDRVSGLNAGWGCPLENVMDGLPARYKYNRNAIFTIFDDKIYMPGTSQPVDLRIRYAQFFPDFTTQGPTFWYQQPVPITGCLDALADYICVEASDGRDDVDSQTFKSRAENEAKLIFNRDVRLKNRSNVRRRPRSGPRNGLGLGYGNNFGDW